MTNSQELESVELPTEVVERIETRVDHTEFEAAGAYITHVLEEVLYELEQDTDRSDADAVDEQQVEERLKSLGYLNE
jgi:Arc/MetJ-type ribon-helix-helix transcriptional regulator